jgi:hypothetical protein
VRAAALRRHPRAGARARARLATPRTRRRRHRIRPCAGSYVANRVSDKITALADRIYVCRSGSAADTQVRARAQAGAQQRAAR